MMHKAWGNMEELLNLIYFKVNRPISRSHGTKISPILIRIERFWTVTQVWIHRWLEMMRKAWHSVEEVPYCFFWVIQISRSREKIDDLNPILNNITRPVAPANSFNYALFRDYSSSQAIWLTILIRFHQYYWLVAANKSLRFALFHSQHKIHKFLCIRLTWCTFVCLEYHFIAYRQFA